MLSSNSTISPQDASATMDDMFKFWLMVVVKCLLWFVEIFMDLILGYTITGGSREERRKAWLHHEHSAQLVNVLWKAHNLEVQNHTSWNFLYKHEKYVSPKYILEHKNVTLFTMDTTHAYFCVSDPDVDIYDTKKRPFVFICQYYEAKKLVILPLSSFKRLGDELGDPKVPVCLVNMTARCGSTLVSQIMTRVPNVCSMSEPWAMAQLNTLFRMRCFNWDETRKLIQTCMRLHCKVEPDSSVERIVIKMTPSTSPMFVALHELFPQFDFLFNTRHPKPSINSILKAVKSTKEKSLYLRLNFSAFDFIYNMVPLPYTDKYTRMLESFVAILMKYSQDEMLSLVWGGVMVNYLENKEIYKHVVLYENLTGSPEEETKKLFGLLNIPEEYVPGALEALGHDSQKNTFTRREEKLLVPEETWNKIDNVLAELSVGVSCKMSLDELKAFFK